MVRFKDEFRAYAISLAQTPTHDILGKWTIPNGLFTCVATSTSHLLIPMIIDEIIEQLYGIGGIIVTY